MRIDKLIDKMRQYQLSLPENGSGRNGKVLAADLENTLGDYYSRVKYFAEPSMRTHLKLRRQFKPMKAYRYDKLKSEDQLALFDDNNVWIAEQKFDGWRIMITYIPGEGLAFWGGNISDADFLPTDYTDHVLLDGYPCYEAGKKPYKFPFVIDAECICNDHVSTLDGLQSSTTLDAVGIILGSSPERAIQIQKEGAQLQFKCFDLLLPDMPEFNNSKIPLRFRQEMLSERLQELTLPQLQQVEPISLNKKAFLRKLWNSGAEGVILKNTTQPYVNGGRLRTHAIKVKRTMSGEIGDDIDAFINGYCATEEWEKQGLIGSVELSVYFKEGENLSQHVIAVVSGMPLEIRKQLTENKDDFINAVVVVDGQELSNKHRKLKHARVDWSRGFRYDKRPSDCVVEIEAVENIKF